MTQEAGTPGDMWGRIQNMIDSAVDKLARSGMLNNASISNGGVTIKGGFLRLMSAVTGGVPTFYVGPVNPSLPDGSFQPGLTIRRNDGTAALSLFDPTPNPGDYNQFLAWWDRQGHAIFTDDTDSGFGHARPWLSNAFTAVRYGDLRYTTTSATFETVCDALVNRQQPKWEVGIRASMDTSGSTGEVRVLVDGVQLGTTSTETFALSTRYYGPAAVPGTYGQDALIEVQARVVSGTGGLKLEPRFCRSRQS